MKYNNRIISVFLLTVSVCASFACQKQQAEPGSTPTAATVKAQSPTEAYKLLYAAVKAKNTAQIKQLMSKSSLGLAEFSSSQQKKTVDNVLENGLVAPTLANSLTEMRDERIKDNFGAVEVFNPKDNRWEDLPFVLEDGGWKLAVGDLFQDTFKSPGKSRGQIETEASNTMTMTSSNKATDFPAMNSNKLPEPGVDKKDKSVEVPKEDKPKK